MMHSKTGEVNADDRVERRSLYSLYTWREGVQGKALKDIHTDKIHSI